MKTGLIVLGLCLIWVPSGINGSDSPKSKIYPMKVIISIYSFDNTCYSIKKNQKQKFRKVIEFINFSSGDCKAHNKTSPRRNFTNQL